MRKQAFTLIEMLVVVTIIVVLMGLLLPAVNAAREFAKRSRARTEVKQIELAWKSYLNDYREFPSSSISEMDSTAIDILRGVVQNTRGTRYMEFDSDVTEMLDPWAHRYQVALDDDYDNQVAPGGYTATLDRNIAVWSFGADGVVNTDDDIKSWR
jgi:prepilin-type N-terminal cleavage/methylation domain-containing protein